VWGEPYSTILPKTPSLFLIEKGGSKSDGRKAGLEMEEKEKKKGRQSKGCLLKRRKKGKNNILIRIRYCKKKRTAGSGAYPVKEKKRSEELERGPANDAGEGSARSS